VISSMTGFGRAEFELAGAAFQVEVRSVNHRHLDLQVRLPRTMMRFEPDLRRRLSAKFARGKVEVTVSGRAGAPLETLRIDSEAAGRYLQAARELAKRHGVLGELDAPSLLGLPGVARLAEPELPEAELAAALATAAERAADALVAMRRDEGAAVARELETRLARISALVEEVAGRSETVQAAARERLKKRAEQLAAEFGQRDDARLAQELVWAADRLDVNEELVRLRSHLAQFRAAVGGAAEEGGVGRRLEFLLQELLRETNTVGSKAGDAPVAHLVVDLKTELERTREQVLNVE
jgi:uncharacterized protein (TIGR00255 family)